MAEHWRRVLHAMAMPFAVEVRGDIHPTAVSRAVDGIEADLHYADDTFSLWREDTPMARHARGELAEADCPPDVRDVLDLCDHYHSVTAGAFDARRPDGVIDPTGVVKTWAVARAAWRLSAVGAHEWMIGASGDVLVSAAPGGQPWRIGIADPRRSGDPQGGPSIDVIELGGTGVGASMRAVATSGDAQRVGHIWDPATGEPARHFAQVSVAGRDLVECDVWATAIVAGGRPVIERAHARGLEVLCVGGEVEGGLSAEATPGWPSVAGTSGTLAQ